MRGFVIYLKYVAIPGITVIAAIWAVYIIGRITKWISNKRDKKNRRQV